MTAEVFSFPILCFLPQNASFRHAGWTWRETSESCLESLMALWPVWWNTKAESSLEWWHDFVTLTVCMSLQSMVMPFNIVNKRRIKRKSLLEASSRTRRVTWPRRLVEAQPPWEPHAPGYCSYLQRPKRGSEGWGCVLNGFDTSIYHIHSWWLFV